MTWLLAGFVTLFVAFVLMAIFGFNQIREAQRYNEQSRRYLDEAQEHLALAKAHNEKQKLLLEEKARK